MNSVGKPNGTSKANRREYNIIKELPSDKSYNIIKALFSNKCHVYKTLLIAK